MLEEDELPVLEDLGSCGLHSISGAFREPENIMCYVETAGQLTSS